MGDERHACGCVLSFTLRRFKGRMMFVVVNIDELTEQKP